MLVSGECDLIYGYIRAYLSNYFAILGLGIDKIGKCRSIGGGVDNDILKIGRNVVQDVNVGHQGGFLLVKGFPDLIPSDTVVWLIQSFF